MGPGYPPVAPSATFTPDVAFVGDCCAVAVSLVGGNREVVVARVVGVHGAFHQLWEPNQIKSRWLPALQDGLVHAGTEIDPDDFAVAFYGDVFRPQVAAGRPDREEHGDCPSVGSFGCG